MAIFNAGNEKWHVEFDGITLGEVLSETQIDLADLSASGLAAIEQDTIKLVKVLCVLCREEIEKRELTERQFARLIRRKAIEDSIAAVMEAAADFFPKSRWSAIQSALNQRRDFRNQWTKIQPLMEVEEIRPYIASAIGDMMDVTNLQKLQVSQSVGGSDATQSPDVSDSQESAESIQEE